MMRALIGPALAGACLALCLPASAAAADDPIGSATTTITLAKAFSAVLASHGVSIEARQGHRRSSQITLTAASGEIDPRLGLGTVESLGTIWLRAGKRVVILRQIVFKAKRAPLYAKVGGGQLKLATGAHLHAARSGFGAAFTASGLRLSAKAAMRLNKKLGLGGALTAGLPIGSVRVDAQPKTVHLRPEGRLYLPLDPGFKSKLDGLFVSINPIAPAELSGGPTLSFPVGLEGTLAPDGSSGTVKLSGQVELLQLGNAQMFWREVWFEPGQESLASETDVEPAPPQAGVMPQGPLLTVSGLAVSADPSALTISAASQDVTLSAGAAANLNAAFAGGAPSFTAGEIVGGLVLDAHAE